MKTFCCFLGILCCSVFAIAQDYAVGHVSLTFTDAARNNRNIAVEIFYPAQESGDDVPVADAVFPTLAFGHGFVMGYDAYQNIWETLVPQGFIMMFPKTEGGIAPSHLEFGKDLAFCVAQMQQLNADIGSIFFDRVSATSALMGHSMGGGAAFLGMQQSSQLTALAVLAPAETNPSAIEAAVSVTSASLVIAGENDCVTPASANQLPMYEALSSECKTYVEISGASHCQMADFNLLCQIGEVTCSPAPEIPRADQHQVISGYLIPWLKSVLLQDCEAGSVFNDLIESDEATSFARNCEQCESLAETDFGRPLIMLWPNPFSDIVRISVNEAVNFELFDASGRKLLSTRIDSGTIDLGFLDQGIYVYRIQSNAVRQIGKIVRK